MQHPNRRELMAGIALAVLAGTAAQAQTLPRMTVNKDPSCGCCTGWVTYLKSKGFAIDVVERKDMNRVKAEFGVPADLQSCHTAKIDRYVVEGHVPADAIQRLLRDKPQATGLAVAGMPGSSPGMDVPGATDTYDVILFSPNGQQRYARYQGRRRLS